MHRAVKSPCHTPETHGTLTEHRVSAALQLKKKKTLNGKKMFLLILNSALPKGTQEQNKEVKIAEV